MLKIGDQVSILPEFQDKGDHKFTWVVVGEEEKGRVDISPIDIKLAIKPIYTLKVEQVILCKTKKMTDFPTLEESIDQMKREITEDVLTNLVPKTCATFSELHDYVDANGYGGFCEDEYFEKMIQHFGGRDEDEGIPDGMTDYLNKAQDAINQWIHTGALLNLPANQTDALMRVQLASVGNPDHGQDPNSPLHGVVNECVVVNSLKTASEKCKEYIGKYNIGGGNWSGGDVTRNGITVAKVSYNGRVWDTNGVEINL